MKINYKGLELETIFYSEITNKEFSDLKNEYYSKPEIQTVVKEIKNCFNGNTTNTNITDYFYKDLMSKVTLYHSKFCIEDLFEHKPLLEVFVGKVKANEKVFPKNENLLRNIETAIRIGGKGICAKPSNFPLSTVLSVLKKYNENNNYYDFSCGWGVRLFGSLLRGINYHGTDPNYLLIERLNEFDKLVKGNVGIVSNLKTDIRCTGSEIYHSDWENKIGLAFSSPPYFYLEDYKIGNQSYKEGTSYKDWLENYWDKTIKNCYKYLIDSGFLVINIKDFDKFKLVYDTKKICERNGFVYVGNHTLDNIQRVKTNGELVDNDEQILVFIKDCNVKEIKIEKNDQTSIFDFL